MESFKLNDGVSIPKIGFGVYLIPPDGSTYKIVKQALKAGYRHIDTAAVYYNESEVGQAVKDSGIKREDIFVTSKLWLQDYSYKQALKGLDRSLKKLDLDYIDLYLLHQPYFDIVETYQALCEAKKQGKIRSVGVSNMTPKIFSKFITQVESAPSINQVECNPFFQQTTLKELMKPYGTLLEAWYPFAHGSIKLLSNPTLEHIASKYNKTTSQIILRWHIQEGFLPLPKSTNEDHIKSNIQIFDFNLSDQDLAEIRSLDTGKASHDPDSPGVGELLLRNYQIKD